MNKTILETVVGTLPAKAQPYAKTYAAVLISGLAVLSASLDLPAWVTIALAVANAPVVFAVPNLDPNAEKQDESVQPPAFETEPEGYIADGLTLDDSATDDKPTRPQHGWGDGI